MHTITIPQRLEFNGSRIGLPLVGHSGFDAFREPLGLREHVHRSWELTYVFSGRVTWEVAGRTSLALAGGDMAITQPGQPHRGRLDVIEPSAIFWTNLELGRGAAGTCLTRNDLRGLARTFTRAGNSVRYAAEAINDDLVRLHATMAKLRAAPSRARNVLAAQARALMCLVVTSAAQLLASGRASRNADSYTRAACDYMADHLTEDIDVSRIAEHLGISASRLHTLFRQKSGTTPNDYLQRLRIDAACKELAASDAAITTIGLRLGFSSSQYFATCFRKYTGMTPGAFRRKGATRSA
jgi:AraC-like DNA-binding protein